MVKKCHFIGIVGVICTIDANIYYIVQIGDIFGNITAHLSSNRTLFYKKHSLKFRHISELGLLTYPKQSSPCMKIPALLNN